MTSVLYISNYKQGTGGISAQVEMLHRYIQQEGYSSDIFSTKGNPIKRIGLLLQLLCIIRRYDIVHIHACSDRGMLPVIYGVIAGKIWGKHIVITYHGGGAADYFERHGAFARRWLKRADKVIVLNGYLDNVFEQYGIPHVVIPNIITLREDVYVPKKAIAPKIISIRHLRELYRIDSIIKAYQKISAHYPDATLDILGQGDQREALEQYVNEHRLKGVRFVGQVHNEQIYDYLRANDIMVSAPRVDNMPVSVLEAMNAGLLVISSNVGGVPYMIEHQRTGLLFESNQDSDISNRIAEQIEWTLEHQEECLQIIKAAHKEVQRYSWKEVRKQILMIYESL